MRLNIGLVLLFLWLGLAPAEAQLFRKIFSKSGGRDRNIERPEEPVAPSLPPPVVEERVPASNPEPVATDTIIPDKPVEKSGTAAGVGKRESSSGFRVQFYNGANRTEAVRLKQEMENTYPEYGVYILYRQPNFKVRMGDFRSQKDAELLLPQIRRLGFKTSFVVPDEIFIEP